MWGGPSEATLPTCPFSTPCNAAVLRSMAPYVPPVMIDSQYLADMYAVHAALEESLAAAADAEAAAAGAAGGQGHQRLLSALDLFGLEQGLARSAALLHDLQRLSQQPGSAQHVQQQQQQQPAGSSAAPPLPATQQAAAYASYIASLARLRAAAEGPEEEEQVGAGRLLGQACSVLPRSFSAMPCICLPSCCTVPFTIVQPPLACNASPAAHFPAQAVLRLLAHAYTVYLMHLTSGGRIAAAAVQKLLLPAIDALAFYR